MSKLPPLPTLDPAMGEAVAAAAGYLLRLSRGDVRFGSIKEERIGYLLCSAWADMETRVLKEQQKQKHYIATLKGQLRKALKRRGRAVS